MLRWPWLLASGMSLIAQQASTPPSVPYIRVHGEAIVLAQPDRLQMDVGVISQGATSLAAAELNAKQSNAVIEQLSRLIRPGSIKTVNFSVNPNFQYPKDGSPPAILGYTANNTVRLELDDMALVRKVIDVATRSGANNVNRMTFGLHDASKARAEALGSAADQARAGAQALAGRMKVKLGRVLRLEEEQPVIVSPGRDVEFSGTTKNGAADSVPVEPGTIEIHASVSLTFEVIQ